MITQDAIILKYGLNDGKDEIRMKEARRMSGLEDISVETCFYTLVKMEKEGLITLENTVSNKEG